MRGSVLAALLVLLAAGAAGAQATTAAPAAAAPTADRPWSFYASAATYILPDEANYVQPAITPDRGRLHLEGRFNYEDRDTGSAWFGCTFSAGEAVAPEFTPIVGAVVGNTTGVAAGYRGTLAWRILQLYSETEFVIDTGASADSFLYTWSEFEVAPRDWFRFGLVVQRTKTYTTEFDIQRGFFAGVSYGRADVSAYIFNPDADRPTVVVAIGMGF